MNKTMNPTEQLARKMCENAQPALSWDHVWELTRKLWMEAAEIAIRELTPQWIKRDNQMPTIRDADDDMQVWMADADQSEAYLEHFTKAPAYQFWMKHDKPTPPETKE